MIITFRCMDKENKKSTRGYDRMRLLDDLFAQAERDSQTVTDITSRMKWLNIILKYDTSDKSKEEIINEFTNLVEADCHIFPFICYLSSKKHYSHTWGYLIDQKDEYIKSFPKIEVFVDTMLANVNSFMEHFCDDKEFSISVNDLFTFGYDNDTKVFYGKVDWAKCYDLLRLQKQYFIKLYYRGALLFVKTFTKRENVIDKILVWKEISKTAEDGNTSSEKQSI